MKKISRGKDSRFKTIQSKYGVFIDAKYFSMIIKDRAEYEELMRKTIELKNDKKRFEKYFLNYLDQNFTDDKIDYDAFIYFTYRTLIDSAALNNPKYAITANNCIEHLKKSRYSYYEIDRKTKEIKRTSAQSLIGRPEIVDDSKDKEKLKRLFSEFAPATFFSVYSNYELPLYCQNKSLVSCIIRLDTLKALQNIRELTEEEVNEILYGKIPDGTEEDIYKSIKVFEKENPAKIKDIYGAIPEYLQKYPQEFDLDKILLITAFRIYELLEFNNENSREEILDYALLLNICLSEISDRKAKISGIKNRYDEDAEFSYTKLKKVCERITKEGYYLSNSEEESMKSELFDNSQEGNSLLEHDPDKLSLIKFSDEEYDQLLQRNGSMIFLIKNNLLPKKIYNEYYRSGKISQADMRDLMTENMVTDKEAKDYLLQLDTIDQETFELLCDRQMLSEQEIFDMFMKEKISFEAIDGMQTEEKQKIAQMLSVEKLAELYRKSQEEIAEEKTEGRYTKEYLQYIQLYRNLIRRDKTVEEKMVLDEKLLDAFNLNLENEDLENLYNSHLLLIDTLRGYANPEFMEGMMKRAEIRPADARAMCLNDDLELLYRALRDENISKTRKMAISRTTFANIYDNDLTEEERQRIEQAEQECWRLMGFKNKKEYLESIGEKEDKNEEENENDKDNNRRNNQNNKWVFNPSLRWDLIDLMGPHSYEVLDSGLIIYKFPDYKGGRVLLEKMFKNNKLNYGRATRIIDIPIEEFEKIKKEIIIGDDIYPAVIDSRPEFEGKVTTISHTRKWPTQLADYFEARTPGQRTPEEIARVNQKIERVLDSRSILE